jgi:hypothetical protein
VGFPAENGGSLLELVGLHTERIVFGVSCDSQTSVCANGAAGEHLAWAVLYRATVILTDPSDPVLSSLVNPIPAWQRESLRASWSASDNSGIASTAVRIDGANVSNLTLGCDRSQPVPCPPSTNASHVVDSRKLADGPHTLVATATDAAGNVARSEPRTILVDNHAPGAPERLEVAGGEGWRAKNAFDVAWGVPDQAPGSPVAKVHWRLCAADGACEAEQVVEGAVGELRGLAVPRQGDWTLGVWFEDVAGNVAEASGGKVHLRFGPDPRAVAGLRLSSFVRRGARLVVRGSVAKSVGGSVVVRVRRVPRRQAKPRVARRARIGARSHRFAASMKLPAALRRAKRLRVSVSYGGDAGHRPVSIVRIVRPRARAPRRQPRSLPKVSTSVARSGIRRA